VKAIKTTIFIAILLGLTCVVYAGQFSKLMVFYSPGCHRCVEVKKEVMPKIEAKYKGKITIEYFDITNIDNHKLFLGLKGKYGPDMKEFNLPVFFMQGKFLNTKADLGIGLRNLIDGSLAQLDNQLTGVSGVDLTAHFKGFKPLVILGSGLVDGINPCAFTVIVFFISYLALQGYRKKELIVIGLSFIFSVFVTYSLIGLGIFNFLYRMKSFWFFVRIFNISVGIFSVILGIFALYDLFKFIKTKDTQGLILQLPRAIKNRIHSVISLHYRKSKEKSADKPRAILPRLILSALITGFLVSILEAVCTGQLYLPTIAFVLKTTPLKLQALAYLVIYNIMFIFPLLVIFMLALFGVTSAQFANFLKKNLAGVKVIMAFVFFSLGIFLIWRG
jgi:cytochrome c biogenesis protein CcdA